MVFFLGIAVLGALMLGVSIFAGSDHGDAADCGDHGPDLGFFNIKTIALFTVGTGSAGALATMYLGGSISLLGSAIGVLGGLGLGVAGYKFLKVVYRQQATSLFSHDDLPGLDARVSVQIPEGGLGQISCEVRSRTVYQEARSRDGTIIDVGASVLITEVEDGVAIVEGWDQIEEPNP